MNICIVNSFYYPEIVGGAEISVQKLAEGMKKKGENVTVLCNGRKDSTENINGVTIKRIKINNLYYPLDVIKKNNLNKIKCKLYNGFEFINPFNYLKLLNTIKTINPDIIHVNNVHGFTIIIWIVARKLNIPVVQTLRDYQLLFEKNTLTNRIKRYICKKISYGINYVTAPSEYTLNYFKENNYFINNKTKVVYNAIDYEENQVKEVFYKKIKQLSRKETIKFVYLGRLEGEKGINFLLDVFAEVTLNNICLKIAGDGSEKDYVKKICNQDNRIEYLGFLKSEDIQKLLSNSDVLIVPSLWPEPFGRVVIEAYKYSMPVIVCKSGGLSEIVNNNINGKVINIGSKDELREALIYYSDRSVFEKYIKNNIEYLNKFNINTQVENFTRIYEELLR